jgi:hypothetical protein
VPRLTLGVKLGEKVRLRGPDGTVTWVSFEELRGEKTVALCFEAGLDVEVLREKLVPRPVREA